MSPDSARLFKLDALYGEDGCPTLQQYGKKLEYLLVLNPTLSNFNLNFSAPTIIETAYKWRFGPLNSFFLKRVIVRSANCTW